MYLIVGLGNPGKKYEHTRHNAGFDSIDLLAAECQIPINKAVMNAHVGKGSIAGEQVILAKPQTYMNLSGQAVQAILHFYKISPEQLIVIHDDSDLDAGKLRLRRNGSAGGHNGIKDIIKMIGTQEFKRIRVGVGHRPEYMDQVDFVLGRASGEEKTLMEETYERAARAAEDILKNGMDHAMNHFNG